MPDKIITSADGYPVRLSDMGDGTFALVVKTTGGGGGGGGASGDVTTAGVSGTQAQAVQGATNGVPLRVAGTALDNIDADLGATNATPATDDTGNWSLIALVKRALQNWTTLLGRIPALGPANAAASIPVVQSNDTTVSGPTGQSVLNTDLLSGTVNGWYDAGAFQSGSIQIIASAGISAGAIFFEQTNDTVNAAAGVPLRAYETSSINSNPNVAAFNIAASTARIFTVPINARFIRVRISTAFVGGTVQAVATMSQRAASFPVVNVQQATAGNLQVTATIAATQTLSTVTTLGTLTGGAAAEDAATTSNPHIVGGVVRTAVAPTTFVAGDAARHTMTSAGQLVVKEYGPAQVEFSANLALTTTTAAAIVAAAGAGIRNHITSFWAINTGAATVDLIILDGAAERARYPLPINIPVPVTFPTGLLTTTATALNANLSAAGTVRLVATGYTSA
jgi:hypothetical protein